jgi:hypothetical protein
MSLQHLDITYNRDNLSSGIRNADENDEDDDEKAFYNVGDDMTPNDGSLSFVSLNPLMTTATRSAPSDHGVSSWTT